jgi:hypothetical protein
MRRHEHRRRIAAEHAPKDLCDAADVHAADLYVELADAIPGKGRKALGTYARRVSLMVSHMSSPTAADWERLVRAGGDREAVIAFYIASAEQMRGVPMPDVRGCVLEVVRESAEAVEATLRAEKDPSLLPVARDETFDLYNAAGRLAVAQIRADRERTDLTAAVRGRLGLGA